MAGKLLHSGADHAQVESFLLASYIMMLKNLQNKKYEVHSNDFK